jgi:short subunit dehydrogenase-like uncharacterized protein
MPILIYGATGFSGRLIAETLAQRGHDIVVAGRDHDRARALGEALGVPWRAASIDDPKGLAAAFDGASLVLSCAGPFAELGEPVLRAALEAGAGFADISGEQAYARDLYERYESRARRERRVIVTGLAFEPAAGDWAAALAARALGPGRLDEVVIAYALSRVPLTPGVVASARSALAAPASVWAHDRWEASVPGGEQELIGFPAPFGQRLTLAAPLAASITVPRHIDTEAARTLVAAGRATPARKLALRLAAAAAPALARSPLIAEVSALIPAHPTEDELENAQVAVVAIARRGFEQARVALIGPHIYRLTAEIAALTVPALASCEGALAPSEIVDPAVALEALQARAGIHIERAS